MANEPRASTPGGRAAAPRARRTDDPHVKIVENENILSFMATEYENSLVSTLYRGRHLEALRHVDSLFRHPRPHLLIPPDVAPIPALMLFCHFQLYMTFTNFLRCHLTYALVGVRKAIDAALTAYVLIEHPERMDDYRNGHNNFVYIKNYMTKQRTADPTLYPIAETLLKTHDTCSKYGAHVDFATLSLMTEQITTAEGVSQNFKYFHVLPEVETDLLLVDSLCSFIEILRIFAPFLKQYARPEMDYDSWREVLSQVKNEILDELAKQHSRFDAQQQASA